MLLLALLLNVFCACAQGNGQKIVLQDKQEADMIGKQVLFFEDSTARLTITDITTPAIQQKFRQHPHYSYARSVSGNAVWFKIVLQNKTGNDAWLEAGGPYSCQYIDFYKPDTTGQYAAPVLTGSKRPEANKPYPVNFYWLPLSAANDTAVKTYYVKMQSTRDAEYIFIAGTVAALHKGRQLNDYLTAGFVGIMLIMIFYNIFLFFATRQSIYVIYVGYLITALFSTCYISNYSLFPANSWFDTHFSTWINLAFVFVGWFTSAYLNLKKNYPRIFWLMWVQIALLSFVFPIMVLAGAKPADFTGLHNTVLFMFYITFLVSSIYLYIKGGNVARYYFWGWIFASISLIVLQFETHNLIPYHLLIRNILYFGVVLEVLMFAFALGERLNTLRDEKEKAQAEYIKLAKQQKRELEEKVEARTKELQVQSKYLEEVNATKDKLFSILGHDLRGPIANLKAMLDLAASNDISGEDFLQQTPALSRGVENVLYILEDLLQWSYAQRKGIKSFPVEIDLHTITNQKQEIFKELAASKKITLVNTVPPKSMAFADENQVKLILRNLISNAIKFTLPGGSIHISSVATPNTLLISVKDTGKGMTEEEMNKLFKATTNFTTTGTGGEKGIGLGLLLCKEMAESNAGKIWAASKKGEGSTFNFTLPVNPQQA